MAKPSHRIAFFAWIALALFPLLLLLGYSFSGSTPYPQLWSQAWDLRFWQMALSSGEAIRRALWHSLLISFSVGLLATFGGSLISRSIVMGRHASRWLVLAYLPYLMAPVVLGITLNHYFLQLGLSGTVGGVVLAQLIIAFPFAVLLFTSFWNGRIRQLEQASENLGASPLQTFRKVVWPLSRPLFFVCFFQCFLISWFDYGLAQVIGFGKIRTLTLLVYRYVREASIGFAACCSLLLLVPPILLMILNRKYLFHHL